MRRHRRDLPPMSSINLTNLLDIVFCLLIAFMIVAPTLDYGLELELPQVAESHPLPAKKPVMVSVKPRSDPEGQEKIYMDGKLKSLDELRKAVQNRHDAQPDVNVVLQCDKRVPSGVLLQVIGAIQSAGIEGVGLETDVP
jgi:biopolymer transport protein ExbD